MFAAAAVGAMATSEAPFFYAQLVKPTWAPPTHVFGLVWTVLYLLMGIAAWLVWEMRRESAVTLAITLFALQLGANPLWSWLFFAWHRGGPALACLLVLAALVAATLIAFWRVRGLAGLLLVPYLAWLGIAGALNWTVWQANPQLLGLDEPSVILAAAASSGGPIRGTTTPDG